MSFPNCDEKQVSSSVILYLGRQKMDLKEAKKCISATFGRGDCSRQFCTNLEF